MIGIYKIENLINGKVYIGQSINVEKRLHEHFYKSNCKKDVSYKSALHSAIRKYGASNFSTEILCSCDYSELDDLEKFYIKKYNSISPNGYNILSGGQLVKAVPIFCKKCGKQITKYSKTGFCVKCSQVNQRRVIRPSKDELIADINSLGYLATGRKYCVSDNTIRKWLKTMSE